MIHLCRILGPLGGILIGKHLLKEKRPDWMVSAMIYGILLVLSSYYFSFSFLEVFFYSAFLSGVYTDHYSGRVYNLSLYLMVPFALSGFYAHHSYIAALFMLLLPLYKKSRKLQFYFGEADVYVLLFISMAYGRNVFYTLFYASALGLLYAVVGRRREIYFLPFLFFGLLLSHVDEFHKFFGILL